MTRHQNRGNPRTSLSEELGSRDHVVGLPSASVTLIEYGAYECAFCRAAAAQVDQLLADLAGEVRFAFRHFPVALVHPHSHQAAEAAEAAAADGLFWPMHQLLLASHSALDRRHLITLALELGIDGPRVEAALDSHVHLPRVRRDLQSGVRSGVTKTPSFFVNGARFAPSHDAATVEDLLDAVRDACVDAQR